MSSGTPLAAVGDRTSALILAALLALTVQAASPSALAQPGTAVRKGTPTAPLPPDKPKSPAARRPVGLTRQMPLGEALDMLRNSTTPPMSIIVLWRPLEQAGIDRNTPIGIDAAPGLRVGQYLDLLTLSLSAGASAKIGHIVNKGAITISTTDALPTPKPITRLYDISDLVAPPGRYSPATMGFGMGYGGPTTLVAGYAGGNSTNGVLGPTITPRTTGQGIRTDRRR